VKVPSSINSKSKVAALKVQMGGQLHVAPVAVQLAPRACNGDPQSRIKHHHHHMKSIKGQKGRKPGQPLSGEESSSNKLEISSSVSTWATLSLSTFVWFQGLSVAIADPELSITIPTRAGLANKRFRSFKNIVLTHSTFVVNSPKDRTLREICLALEHKYLVKHK